MRPFLARKMIFL